MKTTVFSLFISWLFLPPQILADTAAPTPRLAGIVHLPDLRAAWLETVPTRSGRHFLILRETQREGDVEVLQIDPQGGTVKLLVGRTNVVLTLSLRPQVTQVEAAAGSLELVDAGLDPVLSLYAECKGRTLLRSPRLPATSFTLAALTTNQAQAALVLEKALAERGIATIPDGERFLMVVPASEATAVKPHSADLDTPPRNGFRPELMPVGIIQFNEATLYQAADIYASLIGRKLDRNQPRLQATLHIIFRNQTPLTKEECLYALDTLFYWQGVKVVPVGNGSAMLVPISDAGK